MKPRRLPSGNWNTRVMLGGQSYSFTHSDRREVMRMASAFAAEHPHQDGKSDAFGATAGLCARERRTALSVHYTQLRGHDSDDSGAVAKDRQ